MSAKLPPLSPSVFNTSYVNGDSPGFGLDGGQPILVLPNGEKRSVTSFKLSEIAEAPFYTTMILDCPKQVVFIDRNLEVGQLIAIVAALFIQKGVHVQAGELVLRTGGGYTNEGELSCNFMKAEFCGITNRGKESPLRMDPLRRGPIFIHRKSPSFQRGSP